MDSDERIQTHLVSVWGEEKKFLKRGTEGMLFLTEKHLMFVTKTEAKMKWWETASTRQLRTLLKSNDIMIHQDGYNEENLQLDLENDKNLEVSFDMILNVGFEEKPWAPILKLEINMGDKTKKYHFAIVGGWVKYPLKDPMKYVKVNWVPFIEYIKSKQRIME